MIGSLEKGDLPAAQACQLKAVRFIEVILRYHGLSGIKAAMTLAGVPCGPTRLPSTPLTSLELTRLKEELDALDFSTFANRGVSRCEKGRP